MKVILQQDVKGQGKKGQLVDVSDGYARNFLLPKKLAVIATAENLNTMKQQEKARKAQEAAEKAEAEATAKKLEGLTVKIGRQGRRGRTALRRRHRQGGLRGPGRPAWHHHCQGQAGSGRAHQGMRRLSDSGQAGL